MKTIFSFLMFFSLLVAAENDNQLISEGAREKYLKRAQVWHPTDIPTMDIMSGPQSEFAVPFNAEVSCTFIEPKEKLAGVQPKFLCKGASGEVFRVKYGQEVREIYAEVIASRLFWALGFFADEVYPVRLKCMDCPPNPADPKEGDPRSVRTIEDAIIERNFPGTVLESKKDEGWKWTELEKVDEKEGGASRKYIDAFRLLSSFVQHADSKADNQRLGCYAEDFENAGGSGEPFCKKPVLMIQDLGSTFGSGGGPVHISKMEFTGWKSTPVFDTVLEAKFVMKNNQKACVANIQSSVIARKDGLDKPFISEEGRAFLASLLNQLTDKQIRDLFYVARLDRLNDFVEKNGVRQQVTAEEWALEFVKKRREIDKARCSRKSD